METDLANPNINSSKRKRAPTEDKTYLAELFDSPAPSLSSRSVPLRPLKVAKYHHDSEASPSHSGRLSSENISGLENAPLPATEPLEKLMELCFGVVLNKSVASLPKVPKRKRSDSGDNDSAGIGTRSTKLIKQSDNTVHSSQGRNPSTLEWSLDGSRVLDLAEICPFSLYPNSSCAWGPGCGLKTVCLVGWSEKSRWLAYMLNLLISKGRQCWYPSCTKSHVRWSCGFLVRGEQCPNGLSCAYGHDRVEQRTASYARRSDHAKTGK